MEPITKSKSKRSSKKGKSKISFDEELITKEDAKVLVSKEKDNLLQQQNQEDSEKPKKKRKKNKDTSNESRNKTENNESSKSKKKKTKNEADSQTPMDTGDNNNPDEEEEEVSKQTNKEEKKESNRSIKKRKHAKILEEKKVQIELELQQKALNYLSKWKHSKSEWKFEKLRQIWLQQNLFDSSKVPDEFWDTVVQYFNGAQGQSRQTVFDEALKFIENSSEEKTDEEYQIKLKRARDVVQNLE
ncbi:unnamed protein product [Ceutorhynchus assimilis]|uniref:WKF domain-containing protein n=1 Tax=Ceutorhynchus assimilis TaxID=467358 RepID=A0A9N9MJY9_9CUCU|nr:unnamed protein product [Ceutorhynchus assimilis]